MQTKPIELAPNQTIAVLWYLAPHYDWRQIPHKFMCVDLASIANSNTFFV